MTWRIRALLCVLSGAMLFTTIPSKAQWFSGGLKDPGNRADYIILTSAGFVDAVLPLAQYRRSENSRTVMIVLVDSVVSQFHRATADSSIRDFVTVALTEWSVPRPQFLLLAGNTNIVPSHSMESPFPEILGEDSVLSDLWLANGSPASPEASLPGLAVGRFPAWTPAELSVMVEKTIAYECAVPSDWAQRSIAVADSTDWRMFEPDARSYQSILSAGWPDTATVHLRTDSPLYRTRKEFRALLDRGCALVNFIGHQRGPWFAHQHYFSSFDAESLQAGSPFSVYLFGGSQRFEEQDTLSMAVALLAVPGRGAVCAIAPSGLEYQTQNEEFQNAFGRHLILHPGEPVGVAWRIAVSSLGEVSRSRRTLLGDPALVVKSALIASTDEPEVEVPSGIELHQNYPNPFNPSTTIRYALPGAAQVSLKVFDVLGREVALLADGVRTAGQHEVKFTAAHLSSGVYVYQLRVRLLEPGIVSGRVSNGGYMVFAKSLLLAK